MRDRLPRPAPCVQHSPRCVGHPSGCVQHLSCVSNTRHGVSNTHPGVSDSQRVWRQVLLVSSDFAKSPTLPVAVEAHDARRPRHRLPYPAPIIRSPPTPHTPYPTPSMEIYGFLTTAPPPAPSCANHPGTLFHTYVLRFFRL